MSKRISLHGFYQVSLRRTIKVHCPPKATGNTIDTTRTDNMRYRGVCVCESALDSPGKRWSGGASRSSSSSHTALTGSSSARIDSD